MRSDNESDSELVDLEGKPISWNWGLADLHKSRGNITIAYLGSIDDSVVQVLYEYLRSLDKDVNIDLVLYTTGGLASAAHRVAHLLHEYTDYLTIFLPYKARSAGTLLCLAAAEIVMSSLSELSPLDSNINSADKNSDVQRISSEDIRAFKQMAETWFDIPDNNNTEVFSLLAQAFLPSTLGLFYRSNKLVRHIAQELLLYQRENLNEEDRNKIIEGLISGYHSHDYSIIRQEAVKIGLNIKFASQELEEILWNIYREYSNYVENFRMRNNKLVSAMIISESFVAQRIHVLGSLSSQSNSPTASTYQPSVYWQICRSD